MSALATVISHEVPAVPPRYWRLSNLLAGLGLEAREPGALGDQWEVDLGEPQVLTPYALATFCPVLTAVVPRS
eukprot:879237-Rhodomonas_salina.2